MKHLKLYILLLSFPLGLLSWAQEIIDPQFGTNGMFISQIDYSEVLDIQFQSDDKMIAFSTAQPTSNFLMAFYRLNLDGTLDESFGSNGQYLPDLDEVVNCIHGWDFTMDTDENIYFTSTMRFIDSLNVHLTVTKITANGLIDESFGNNGYAVLPTPPGAIWAYGNRIAFDNNGKIIAYGSYKDATNEDYRYLVARFNQDGTLDLTFGENGMYMHPSLPGITNQNSNSDIIINPDNSIVLPGYGERDNSSLAVMVIKLTPDGILDNSFANNGTYLSDNDKNIDSWSAALLEDNSILLCGYENENYNDYKGMATKISADGILDTSFGTDGYGTYFSGGQDTVVNYYDICFNNDEIILVGDILDLTPFVRSTIVTKINTDGTPVEGYGENGTMLFSSPNPEYSDMRTLSATVHNNDLYCAGGTIDEYWTFFGMVSRIIDEDTTGIIPMELLDLDIYPNPANNVLNINSMDYFDKVQIFNLSGQLVTDISDTQKMTSIDISKLVPGLYTVKVYSQDQISTKKLVIE